MGQTAKTLTDAALAFIAPNSIRQRKYRAVFETEDGQWVLRDLAKWAGLHRDQLVPGDVMATGEELGKVRVIKRILSILTRSPASMIKRLYEEEDEENV